MNEKERKELIEKILSVDRDVKSSKVASTIFIKRATKQEALFFMDYLNNSDTLIKKIARQIIGQKGITEALEQLTTEFYEITDGMTFLPDEEIEENVFFANLIELIETIFLIYRSEDLKNDILLSKIDEIFKRTKNEDLRFSLIKLLGVLGDRFELFMELYQDFTTKEKRALYFIYSFIDDPRKSKIYELGLSDKENFNFVISNALLTKEGREIVNDRLVNLSDSEQRSVLTKLLDGKYTDFQDTLILLLNVDNKHIIELAAENLKQSIKLPFPIEKFKDIVNTGYSPDLIKNGLKLINNFVKKHVEEIYLEALNQQSLFTNKIIIIETLFNKLKVEKKITEDFSKLIKQPLLGYFTNYKQDKDDFLISILKIMPMMNFSNSATYKSLRKEIISFAKQNEDRITTVLKNNMNEAITRINALIAKVEKTEKKIGDITILFDLPTDSIDVERFDKLKLQLEELEFLDDVFIKDFTAYLNKIHDAFLDDWKIRATVLKLLGAYGEPSIIKKLKEIVKTEKSLGARVSAENAIENIKTRYGVEDEAVIIIVPLFYINKLLNDFFEKKHIKTINIKEIEELADVTSKNISNVFISDVFIKDNRIEQIIELLPEDNMKIIIVTAKPEESKYENSSFNIDYLKIPFKPENLEPLIAE